MDNQKLLRELQKEEVRQLQEVLLLQNEACGSFLKLANQLENDEDVFNMYELVAESRKIQANIAKKIAALS